MSVPADQTFVTLYRNVMATTGGQDVLLSAIYSAIRDGRWREAVDRYRENPIEGEKLKIPCFIGSCTCTKRNTEGIVNHSGRIVIDFDYKNKNGLVKNNKLKNILSARSELASDQYTEAVFISVGGRGLAVVVKIDPEHHTESFHFLEKYYHDKYNLVADPACKDVIRARFVSYDPELYVCEDSLVSPFRTMESRPIEMVHDEVQFEQVGILVQECLDKDASLLEEYSDWLNVSFGLADAFGEAGRRYFHQLSRMSHKYDSVSCEDQYNVALKRVPNYTKSENKVTLGTLFKLARDKGIELSKIPRSPEYLSALRDAKSLLRIGTTVDDVRQQLVLISKIAPEVADSAILTASKLLKIKFGTFWHVFVNEKGESKISISRVKLIDWLAKSGFYFAEILPGVFKYVHIQNNVVKEVDAIVIKRFVLGYLDGLPHDFDMITKDELMEHVLNHESRVFTDSFWDCLQYTRPVFLRDTQNSAYYFFKNVAVRVTGDGVTTMDYSQLPGAVWDKQIVDHQLIYTSDEDCDFMGFLSNLAGLKQVEDEGVYIQRFTILIGIIGYMLHGYKDPTNPVMPVLCDATISDHPMGGTGKGLLMSCLSKIVPTVVIDGKNFTFGNQFAYERVEFYTRLVIFEDVNRNFSFKSLFNVATEGMTVRKLYRPEIFIPFHMSPKIGITTNYMITEEGDSVERRKVEYELSAHYSKTVTPISEFGRRFFDDWDDSEWNKFYSYLLGCVRVYLKDQSIIKKKSDINAKERKFLQKVPRMFPEFFFTLERDKIHDKKTVYATFLSETGYMQKEVSINKFTFALKVAAEFYSVGLEMGHSGNSYWFKIVPKPTLKKY